MESGNQPPILNDLLVTHSIGDHIHDTTKWTRFLAIVIIICLSLFLLLVIAAGSTIVSTMNTAYPGLSDMGNLVWVIVIVFFLVFGALAFFLLRFSIYARRGLEMRNQNMFNEGLKALKIYFIIYGVFLILSVFANAFSLLSL